ncbi:cell surface glycoprotein MUC18 [Tiliqua scincoides]|uniref:cell surface glycoprotein MUC18 n=1 Tax=Tiliqua scincoides TaxID=71010 RepID=UPI0034622727
MHRNRLARVALGCLFLASCCGRGADGKVEVSTTSVVEAEVGKKAVITCSFSTPENVTYVNWFYMDKNDRKKIISMFRGTVHIDESEFRGRVNLTEELALAIENVVLQDAKTYVCQVGAGGAGVGENRSELHVFKAPGAPELDTDRRLTASPDIQEIAACVSRNGYPEPTIAWYKNDGLLEHNEHAGVNIRSLITKESSGLVTIRSILLAQVTKEDRKALYRCQVNYNVMGVNKTIESESFGINVHYPSENITLEIRSPTGEVKEGDNVTLFCEADGNPPPLYTFYRTGGHEVDSPGVFTGELFLEDVKKENSDVYQCQAFDSQSTEILTAEVNLYVNYIDGPNITREQTRHPLHRGDNLTLTCHAEGSKHLEFQWQKKGKVVKKGQRLTFTNLVPRDSDTYSCLVTMPGFPGLSRSKRVSVAVHSEPEMLGLKDVVYVEDGELVNLTCSVFSIPQLVIKWSTPGKKVSHSPSNHYHRNSTLSVLVTQELLDTGVNCTATNKLGTTVHHFRLETRSEEPVTTGIPPSTKKQTRESKGVIIVAVVICVLLIAVLGAVLYFLHKKGKLPCGRSGKQEITKPDAHKDKIVVEVKSDKLPEEAELLQDANGEKRSAGDQGERYIDLRN